MYMQVYNFTNPFMQIEVLSIYSYMIEHQPERKASTAMKGWMQDMTRNLAALFHLSPGSASA